MDHRDFRREIAMHSPPPLDIRPAVAAALQNAQPVIGLVSAPITLSLPWPVNFETFKQIEATSRQEGATLAAIAVWQGKLTVGLDIGEVETLAKSGSVLRASRRDLAKAVVGGLNAATTVSASMYLAWRAGIRVLVTSSIGGVSGGAPGANERSWDVSADLIEASQTPVAVVNAGTRSVHNMACTAEVLESYRVPVIGFGTDSFPTFYMRAGSQPGSVRADTPAEVAALLSAHWGMDGAGVVVVHPTPADTALSPDELLPALAAIERPALKDNAGVDKKYRSPQFLMERLNQLTRGKAMRAYQAILIANTRLAAQVARELLK
jgi:pseudouridine-5'-phosphate glycosidase